MWIRPRRYNVLLYGSPYHYERVEKISGVVAGWGDFELLQYVGKIPRFKYLVVYDRRYVLAQGDDLEQVKAQEWTYVRDVFPRYLPVTTGTTTLLVSTKQRAKWVAKHFAAVAEHTRSRAGSAGEADGVRIEGSASAESTPFPAFSLDSCSFSEDSFDDDSFEDAYGSDSAAQQQPPPNATQLTLQPPSPSKGQTQSTPSLPIAEGATPAEGAATATAAATPTGTQSAPIAIAGGGGYNHGGSAPQPATSPPLAGKTSWFGRRKNAATAAQASSSPVTLMPVGVSPLRDIHGANSPRNNRRTSSNGDEDEEDDEVLESPLHSARKNGARSHGRKSAVRCAAAWVRKESYEVILLCHSIALAIAETWAWVHYAQPWVDSLTTDIPNKEQRTKKYIVYGCAFTTVVGILFHCTHGALFFVFLVAMNYLTVYVVQRRTDLLLKLARMKASHASTRNKKRIMRAVRGKSPEARAKEKAKEDKRKEKGKEKEKEKEDESGTDVAAAALCSSDSEIDSPVANKPSPPTPATESPSAASYERMP